MGLDVDQLKGSNVFFSLEAERPSPAQLLLLNFHAFRVFGEHFNAFQ